VPRERFNVKYGPGYEVVIMWSTFLDPEMAKLDDQCPRRERERCVKGKLWCFPCGNVIRASRERHIRHQLFYMGR
jgi:hypothetical protein